jgi:hypothetical protein
VSAGHGRGDSRIGWRVALAELGAYVGLVVWLTWPLAAHLETHLASMGGSDALHGIWALAWNTRALATQPGNLFDPSVLHPTPRAFFYSPHGLSTVPVFAPVFLATGNPLLAFNLTLIGCISLTAWGLHRVTAHWTGSRLAGFVAGCSIIASPLWTPLLTRWPTYLSTYYLPWIAALLALPTLRAGTVVALGTLIALQCLTDPVYVAPSAVAPVAVVAIGRLARRSSRRSGLQLLAALLGASIALGPLYAGYLGARSVVMAPTLARLASAAMWKTLAVPLSLPWQEGFAPVTYTTIVLIMAGALSRWFDGAADDRARRAWRHGTMWTVVGVLLCAPIVIVFGTRVANPLYALVEVTTPRLLDVLRGTQRLSFAMTMGLALLSGLGFAECRRRLGRRSRPLGLVVALAGVLMMYVEWRSAMVDALVYARDEASRPLFYDLTEAIRPDSPVIDALRRGQGPVLELPPTHQVGADAYYRSIFHRRPVVNGYTSYVPPGYGERMALAARLPEPAALDTLIRQTGLTTLVVHGSCYLPGSQPWRAFSERELGVAGLRLVKQDGDELVLEVTSLDRGH